MGESLAELCVRLAKSLLRIDFQETRDVDQREENISDFVFRGFAVGGGLQLGELFVELVINLIDRRPVESGSGGFGRDLVGLD